MWPATRVASILALSPQIATLDFLTFYGESTRCHCQIVAFCCFLSCWMIYGFVGFFQLFAIKHNCSASKPGMDEAPLGHLRAIVLLI